MRLVLASANSVIWRRILRLGITVTKKMLVVFQRTFLGQILKHGITFLGFPQAPLTLAYSTL
jgi:hypothetical protein